MAKLILPVRYKTRNEYYTKYISLFHSELRLTERELQVLVQLVISLVDIITHKTKDFPDRIIFESSEVINFCKANNLSITQYHNIKNSLIEKQAIFKTNEGLIINRLLIPKSEISFKFEKDDK